MGMKRQLAGATALCVLFAGAAHAEFAAEDLWAAWQEQATEAGVKLTSQAERVEEVTLILTGVEAVLPALGMPIALDELRLTSYDDDTVGIELGTAVFAKDGEGADALTLELAHKGLEIIAAQGADKLLSYELGADSLTVHYEQKSEGLSWDPSLAAEPVVIKGAVTFEDVGIALSDGIDGNRTLRLALEAAKVLSEQTGTNPGMDSQSSQTGVIDGMTLSALASLPPSTNDVQSDDTRSFEQALLDGFAVEFEVKQGLAHTSFSETGGMLPMDGSLTFPSSSLGFSMSQEKIAFATEVEGESAIKVTSPMSPEAMDLTIGSFKLAANMPAISNGEPNDYGFQFALRDVVFSENVWAMFDPEQSLARGPFTIDLDLGGLMKSSLAQAGSAIEGDIAGVPELVTMDVKTLLVQAAITALEGKGNLTFETENGMPSPVGKLDFKLSHLGELLKALVGFGVIGEDEAAMTEAMIGGFAVPTSDPNVLTSEVELKSGGAVFVNGQQIQ